MKKAIYIFFLAVIIVSPVFGQFYPIHTVDEFPVHDMENRFYLLMPVKEVYNLLGTPLNVRIVSHPSPVHADRVILEYKGITFIHNDFFDDPVILVIGFSENFQMNNMNLIGLNKNQIIEKFGTPHIVTFNRVTYFRYRFALDDIGLERLTLQFRFNSLGICDGVMLTHSFFNL